LLNRLVLIAAKSCYSPKPETKVLPSKARSLPCCVTVTRKLQIL